MLVMMNVDDGSYDYKSVCNNGDVCYDDSDGSYDYDYDDYDDYDGNNISWPL